MPKGVDPRGCHGNHQHSMDIDNKDSSTRGVNVGKQHRHTGREWHVVGARSGQEVDPKLNKLSKLRVGWTSTVGLSTTKQ